MPAPARPPAGSLPVETIAERHRCPDGFQRRSRAAHLAGLQCRRGTPSRQGFACDSYCTRALGPSGSWAKRGRTWRPAASCTRSRPTRSRRPGATRRARPHTPIRSSSTLEDQGRLSALFPANIARYGPARLIDWLGGPYIPDFGDILYDAESASMTADEFVSASLKLLQRHHPTAIAYLSNVRSDAVAYPELEAPDDRLQDECRAVPPSGRELRRSACVPVAQQPPQLRAPQPPTGRGRRCQLPRRPFRRPGVHASARSTARAAPGALRHARLGAQAAR